MSYATAKHTFVLFGDFARERLGKKLGKKSPSLVQSGVKKSKECSSGGNDEC